jgi:hypothetical protein
MAKHPNPFNSPRRRLARAKQHVNRLEKRIRTFLDRKPYKPVADTDATGTTTHAIKFNRNFPDSWGDAAVEALEALRSALDQTGYAAAVLGGVANPKYAYFPIADTMTDLDALTKGRCKDIPATVSAIFRAFDAYEGGNYTLWALNKLCNANKHRLLVPIGGIAGGGTLFPGGFLKNASVFAPRWNSAKNQIEFAKTYVGGELKLDGRFTFNVAFDEFNGVRRVNAIGILDAMAREVDRVIVATEAECRRLGLLK